MPWSFEDWLKPYEIKGAKYGKDACAVCPARITCGSYGNGNKMVYVSQRGSSEGMWLQSDEAPCAVFSAYMRKSGETALHEWEEQRAAHQPEALTLEAKWRNSAIPRDHWHCELEFYQAEDESQKRALDLVTGICRAERLCAILIGGNGTGKTHLAVCALKAWSGLYITETDLHERWQVFKGYTGKIFAFRAKLEEALCLVIDEAGRVDDADFCQFVYSVLDRRCSKPLPWVLCGNCRKEVLLDRYGPALFSRAIGLGGIIEIKGRDRRIA